VLRRSFFVSAPFPQMLQAFNLRHRVRAASIHLALSASVAALAAVLVFGVWYPGIYRELAGGRELFWLVVTVDVTLGPLLTFAVFNLKKDWPHLRRDLVVIASLQTAALIYGLYTVYSARPVAMVFEVDRFKVVTAAQVNIPELPLAKPEYQRLPIARPWMLGSREPRDSAENNDALFEALRSGIDRAQRPQFWQTYDASVPDILKRAKPLARLLAQYPQIKDDVNFVLREQGVDIAKAKFLPAVGRGGDWVVVLDAQARHVHYLPVDGFF
jgi:hypothetical protein